MQLFPLASVALLVLTIVQAKDMSTIHLRVYNSGVSDWGACTGNQKCSNPTSVCVKYSQYYAQCKPQTLPQGELCGQNDGTNVWNNKNHHKKDHEDKAGAPTTVADWGACTGNLKCSNPTSVCVKYSQYYAQCKPQTLPQGELCGQNDGTNVWKYDHCPSNQKCSAMGKDFRCTNKKHHQKDHDDKAGAPTTVADWGACTGGLKCTNPTSVCVKYSQYYAQCKPKTLPQGELCGQNDGTNVWRYDHCPSNQQCKAVGTDFRCSNKKYHHKSADKDASCTITNESQCDGQNWSGSTCCADPSYECRWSDDGQNVKRCQKIAEDDDDDSTSDDVVIIDDSNYSDSESESDDVVIIDDSDYSDSEDSIDSGSEDYTTYVDDWGDCTKDDVGCSNPTSVCVTYSDYYAQCKPETLPSGELCGQDDGTNVWKYDHCPSGETCTAEGSDYRCKA